MPPPPALALDPVFTGIAKAIYGDDVDVRELDPFGKNAPAALHIDGPMTPEQAKKQKNIALTGMGATGIATVGGLHALSASGTEHLHRMAAAGDEKATAKLAARQVKTDAKAAQRVARVGSMKGPAGTVLRAVARNPKRAALAAGVGWGALHTVELGGDSLGMHAQNKVRRQANASLAKAFRLKPLNDIAPRFPSLRAKRPKLTPMPANPATKAGIFKPVSKSSTKSELTEVTWTGLIAKVDADKRQVFGWASVSKVNGQDVVDLQGDIVPIEEIEKSAYRYVIESRKGGDMHKRVAKYANDQPLHTADMIESFVVTPEKLEKMGLPPDSLPHGWWVGYHVNDDAQWAMVKSGERAGFSIHGSGKRTTVAKADEQQQLPLKVPRGRHRQPRPKLQLKERAEQAVHPPAVKLAPVHSSALSAMGYQPQTRRLAYEMRSRPGAPYVYRVKPDRAVDALTAPSKGHHYATQIRGKAERAQRYTPADRARLFVHPQEG